MLLPRGGIYSAISIDENEVFVEAPGFAQDLIISRAFQNVQRHDWPLPSARTRPHTLSAFVEETSSDGAVLELLERYGAKPEMRFGERMLQADADIHQYRPRAVFDWSRRRRRRSLLWAPGHPGSGRTPLTFFTRRSLNSAFAHAAFIFSKTTDTSTVIPHLAYRLATSYLPFRRFLSASLASNPSVLRQGLRVQFNSLIIVPLRHMIAAREKVEAFISLDGLDQCIDRAFQCELIELIDSQRRISARCRVYWVVSTEGESHIRPLMCNVDWLIADRVDFELVTEAMEDEGIAQTLKQGFADIRRIFAHQLATDKHWPPSQLVDAVSAAVRENFDLASFILHFVADERANDPRGRLEKCVSWIHACGVPRRKDPLHTLHFLYRRFLSEIPPELHTALLLVGIHILYPMLDASEVLGILDLDKKPLYRLFKGLQPLTHVSDPSRRTPLFSIRHTSFKPLFLDVRRSGALFHHDGQTHYAVATWALKTISISHAIGQSAWLRWHSLEYAWRACVKTPEKLAPHLISQLTKIDFDRVDRDLQVVRITSEEWNEFLRWLYRHEPHNRWFPRVDGVGSVGK